MIDTIAMGADNLVEWKEPFDEATGTFIGTDATGSVTLKNSSGTAVTGASSLPLTYAAGPPRRYQATIPSTVSLTAGATYYVEFTLNNAANTLHGFRRWDVVAAYEE